MELKAWAWALLVFSGLVVVVGAQDLRIVALVFMAFAVVKGRKPVVG
jgi:hypothetical protein